MSVAYILTDKHWTEDCKDELITDSVSVFKTDKEACEIAQAKALERFTDWLPENPDEFIWTANMDFGYQDLIGDGVLYMSIGSKKTDTIIKYHILKLEKGEVNDDE